MSELSRDDVVAAVGPISDAAIAEIIATGISQEGLMAARARVIADRTSHTHGPALEPNAFGRVVDILERLHKSGGLGESGSTMT